LLIVERKLF